MLIGRAEQRPLAGPRSQHTIMPAAQRTKTSDKQSVCRKLVNILKKRYKTPGPKDDRPILETMLYAICLENCSAGEADEVYSRLESHFHDLNEVRVSSISELAEVFDEVEEPEIRALRVRNVLRYVFEKNFQFEFENLRRKTLEQATRQLQRVKQLSPFVRRYTLQTGLGTHLVPIDESMRRAAVWLGLVEPEATLDEAADSLKSAVRKADAPRFCHLLRCLATDPTVQDAFKPSKKPPEDGYDLRTAPERITDLFKNASSRRRKRAISKKPPKKAAARNASKGGSRRRSAAKLSANRTRANRARPKKKK